MEVEFGWGGGWVGGVQSHNHVKPNLNKTELGCFEVEVGVLTTSKQLGCDLILISLVYVND